MKSSIRNTLLVALLAAFVQTATAALPGGISGHWYNPEQSGHGITLLLVRPDFAQAVWHVYDPDGNPLTLVIEGEVSGLGIEGQVYAPRGMRFGEFDPADKEVAVWGEAAIEFSSCDRAELSWDATDPAYGEGSMPLQRLAGIAGSDCSLDPMDSAPAGRYTGEVTYDGFPTEPFSGIVDRAGRLWAIERLACCGEWEGWIPSPMYAGGRVPHVIRVEAPRADGSLVGRADKVWWTGESDFRNGRAADGSWTGGEAGGELSWEFGDDTFQANWSPAMDSRSLVKPVDAGVLSGRWAVPIKNQLSDDTAWLDIEADGRACVELSPWYQPPGGCHFEGWIDDPDGDHGYVDFEFHRPEEFPGSPYRGRGWLTDGPQGLELILVGDGGFGLMAYPEP